MIETEVLATIAQLGIGLAGFSGIVLVLSRGASEPTPLERDRLGIMLGASLGATFLALFPYILSAFAMSDAIAARLGNAVMAVYGAFFTRYHVQATLAMRASAPELVRPLPFGSVVAGHTTNILLQLGALFGWLPAAPIYLLGLTWLLFHGAYQFKRILFIRPRQAAPVDTRIAAGNPE
jgi:hypothetical protein